MKKITLLFSMLFVLAIASELKAQDVNKEVENPRFNSVQIAGFEPCFKEMGTKSTNHNTHRTKYGSYSQ